MIVGQGDELIEFLMLSYLPSMNVSSDVARQLCEALKSDPKIFRTQFKVSSYTPLPLSNYAKPAHGCAPVSFSRSSCKASRDVRLVSRLSSLKLVSFFRNQVLQSTKTKWWQLLFFLLRDVILELNCSRTELKVWTHCLLLTKTAHTIYLDNIIVTGFVILFTFPLFC